MIQHIFKISWNERKTNTWIVLEYTLVFCILWFCCDYLYYMGKCYHEPFGFDIENTYRIYMTERNLIQTDSETEALTLTQDDQYTYAITVIERLKQHPDIESAGLSHASVPYSLSNSNSSFYINSDSANQNIRVRYVSSGFFDVFRIKLINGCFFDWTNPADQKQVIISANRDGVFGNYKNEKYKVSDVQTMNYGNNQLFYTKGYTEKVKDTYYEPYMSNAFFPLKKEQINLQKNELIVRVHPNTTKNFEERFAKEMREQLTIGPYMLSAITSLKDMQKNTTKRSGVTDNLNSVYAITLFLIINIFLGIIGTFWYRTESRKSEIGLRIAMGSSKQKIKSLLYTETLILLFISSVIGVNICINIGQTDLLKALGIPLANPVQAGSGIEQYFINFGITFLFLTIVSLIAVWYPAKQSSDMHPAEALHEE